MEEPTPQDEPYIDVNDPHPFEVRDNIEDTLRDGTIGWYPEDAEDDTPIWRYMDLGKFLSLIQTSQLWFSHTSKFDDPYEGRYSKEVAEDIQREKWGIEGPSEGDTGFFIEDNADDYVSCWNRKESQSVALWELYNEGSNGVAVKSTVEGLKSSLVELPEDEIEYQIEFGKVKYHVAGGEPRGYYAPIFTKRDIFEFEKEYRAVMTVFNSLDSVDIEGVKIVPEAGIGLKVDLNTLIDEVYISPGAGSYLEDVIERLQTDYGPDFSIEKSTVFDHPLVDSTT
jgi:hypothetical protein